MVKIYRFAGVRPEPSAAPEIAAVPYDVVTADEARAIIARHPQSFLRVSRSDAELPNLLPMTTVCTSGPGTISWRWSGMDA